MYVGQYLGSRMKSSNKQTADALHTSVKMLSGKPAKCILILVAMTVVTRIFLSSVKSQQHKASIW